MQGLGMQQDRTIGLQAYEQAAIQGSPEAALQLGIIAATGGDAPIDYEKAAYWYQQAAEAGLAIAAYNLAQLYLQGLGVTADRVQAFAWLTAAAEQHYLPAIVVLYQQILSADDEDDPLARAVPWIVRAAELNDVDATQILIDLLDQPKRVSTSGLIKALEKIAAKGNVTAQVAVGDLYAEGVLVKENADLAKRWYEEAASRHHEGALQRLIDTDAASGPTRGNDAI